MNIYIGWDPNETEAFKVAQHSIESNSSSNVNIIPLKLSELEILQRPIERKDGKLWCPISEAPMATEFAISRFAVPFLQKEGWALFCDCDIVCDADIAELFALADDKYAVMVVKHKQETGSDTKMGGQVQTYYSRKNWSSVVLWNCGHEANKRFTLENLNSWPGRDMHAFKWLSDEEIGELPASWNYLVGVSKDPTDIKIAHFTLGGPWIENWQGGPMDHLWNHRHKCANI
jgi:hypothetical protein